MEDTQPQQERKLLPALRRLANRYALDRFESLFVFVTLVSIATISYFVDDKLALLNFYFLPVLLAGYFLNSRSAVLGSVLAILWVFLFVVIDPDSFYLEHSRLGLFLHLVTWGGFLIISGAMIGRLNELRLEKIAKLMGGVQDWKDAQKQLLLLNKTLEDKTQALDAMRAKLESALYSAMDPTVAQMVINNELVNEKREITVLFTDIANFTAAAEEMRPESVVNEMNRLFTHLEPIITTYRGHLDKFVGDGLLAEFGIPIYAQQNALQAVLAGLKMQQKVARRDFRWKMRVGIAHGNALTGLVGSEHRKNYTALGDVVNLASRLQAKCPLGGVCIDSATHEKVKHWFLTRRVFDSEIAEKAQAKERRLAAIQKELSEGKVSAELYVEAGNLSCDLGESGEGIVYFRKAMQLDPACRSRVESRVAEAVLQENTPGTLAVKGKSQRVSAFEVLGLKDPFSDATRLPKLVSGYMEAMSKAEGLARDILLPVEALDGSLGHSQVTAALSCTLADTMGLSDDVQRTAFVAGFFHDVGMRAVPEHLLNQTERLTSLPEQEVRMIQAHPMAARQILDDMGIPISEEALVAIETHHENVDGTGYPSRRSGDKIPLVAKIVRIADEYDSLTSWRAYRDPWDPAAALAEMKRDAANGKLDGKLVYIFSRMITGGLQLPPQK